MHASILINGMLHEINACPNTVVARKFRDAHFHAHVDGCRKMADMPHM